MEMNCLFILNVLTCVSVFAVEFNSKLSEEWENFKKLHKRFHKSGLEEIFRRKIFEKNFKNIEKHNAEAKEGKHSFTQKINKFADMTDEEFRKQIINNDTNYYEMKTRQENDYYKSSNKQIPNKVDWRQLGYVTPVKDQGEKNQSSWAFSSVAALEGAHFKTTGNLISLSEQNLIDCAQNNSGCKGGLGMNDAFSYIINNSGIDTEESYQYKGIDQVCRFNHSTVGATCKEFINIKSGSEEDLTNAIASIGPISVALDADHNSFKFYDSGVYYEPACRSNSNELNHAATVVGYSYQGSAYPVNYFIVKNSWGEDWGNQGYIWISKNVYPLNMCGIATTASYPVI